MNEKKKRYLLTGGRIAGLLQLSQSRYVICGGITTLVNYMIYAVFLKIHMPYLFGNAIAWAGAVIAAYSMNRRWVFQSRNGIMKEFISFLAMRFLTLLAETVLLWIFVDYLGTNEVVSKVVVSVVTVAANYVLCRFKIFAADSVANRTI